MHPMKSAMLIGCIISPLIVAADAIRPGMLNRTQAQEILGKYVKSQTNTAIGRDNVTRLIGNLPKEKANIAILRALLSKKIATEEKSLVLRLLGEMRDERNTHGLNNEIVRELKLHMGSADPEIAMAALYAYTRSGYDKDYLSSMRNLRDRKIIGDDTYFGEHAHLFNYAPEQDQQIMLAEIGKSRNHYALQILASGSPSRSLSAPIKKQRLAILDANEPKLSLATGELGGTDDYASWLNTVAVLRSGDSPADYRHFILQRLAQPGVDPRKILAYLSGSYGRTLIRETRDVRQLDTLNRRLCQYAYSFPTTPEIQEAATVVQHALDEAHPTSKHGACPSDRD